MPLKCSQSLIVKPINQEGNLYWHSLEFNDCWFEAEIEIPGFTIRTTSDILIANKLISILVAAKKQNPDFLNNNDSFYCETKLNFNRNWGFGSSSTLISLLAQWSGTDAYQLLNDTFGGSGYDIACAQNETPLIYQLENGIPSVSLVDFMPEFSDNLYFVYLGKKQHSAIEVKKFNQESEVNESQIDRINSLTLNILNSTDQNQFNKCIVEHEELIAEVLKQKPLKSERFKKFNGEIKSLGAWGGDFILASSWMTPHETENYFKNKGLNTIFKFKDIVLQK